MGGCCSVAGPPELNPDGEPKLDQTPAQMKDDGTELRRAAREQDLDLMEELLQRMPVKQINASAGILTGMESSPDDKGNTALHYSVAVGDAKAVRKLLAYKASAKTRNALGKTPFYLACEAGNRTLVALLLQADADPNIADKAKVSPLMCVMSAGRRKMAAWLINTESTGLGGLDLLAASSAGDSALLIAVRNGWFDTANLILDKAHQAGGDVGAVLNCSGTNRETVLTWILKWSASFALDVALMKRVLDAGADPSQVGFKEKVPPVCLAAAAGEAQAIDTLLTAGANINATDGQKRSALHYASAKGKVDICNMLIDRGLDPAALDGKRNLPLHLAGMRGHGEVARLLMAKGAPNDDPSAVLFVKNKAGVCCWHLALMNDVRRGAGQEAALKLLEQLGGHEGLVTPVEDAKADTPLLLAVSSHQNEVVKRLLAMHPDQVGVANAAGELPLGRCMSGVTHATAAADMDILAEILNNTHGDPLAVANLAEHPLLALCECRVPSFSEKALAALTSKANGAAFNWAGLRNENGLTPLGLAAASDNFFMVKKLLDDVRVDIDEVMAEEGAAPGRTPLMLAAQAGALNAMKVLLNRGAGLMGRDAGDRTVLAHCLDAEGLDSLLAATLLLQVGCPPEDCVDAQGEGFLHRAVRRGDVQFVEMWARHGGNLGLVCSNPKVAGPTGLKGLLGERLNDAGNDEDVLDSVPVIAQADDDDMVADADEGVEAVEAGPLAEGVETEADGVRKGSEMAVDGVMEVKGAALWWDKWWGDVEFEETAGEVDEEEVDDMEQLEDVFEDLEDIVDELLLRRSNGNKKEKDSLRALESLLSDNDDGDGELIPAGPVAEGLADSMKAPLLSMTSSKNGSTTDGKKKKNDFLGNAMTIKEPTLEITDPFLLDGEYRGTPAYMQGIDVAHCSEEDIQALCSQIKASEGVAEEPSLEGESLRLRNMFWYNRSLSPSEFPLKSGQWKKVEKAVASRLKALKKGKKLRRRKNDLPEHPAFKHATPLLMAVRLGRLDVLRVLLRYSVNEINVKDGYGVGPLGYAMMVLARSRNDRVAQALVNDLLLLRPNIERQGSGVMSPLVTATILADHARLAWMVRMCAADLNAAPVFLPDIPTYFRSMWQKQAGRCMSTVMPLHLAIMHRSKYGLIKLLLDLGADANLYGRPRDHAKQWMKYNKKANGPPPGKIAALINFVRSFEIPGLSKPNPWVTPLHLAGRFGLSAVAQLLIARGATLSHYPAVARKTPLMEAAAYARSNFKVSNRGAEQPVWCLYRTEGSVRHDDFPPVPAKALANESKKALKMLMDYKEMAVKVVIFAIKQVVKFVLQVRRRPVAHADPSLATAHVLLWHRAHISWADTSTNMILRDLFDNRTYGWMNVRGVADGTEPGGWAHVAAQEVVTVRDAHYSKMQSAKVVKAYTRELARLMCSADKVYFRAGQRNFMTTYAPLVDAANAEQRRRAEEESAASAAARESALAKRAEFVKEKIIECARNLQSEVTLTEEELLAVGSFDEGNMLESAAGDEGGGDDGLLDIAREAVTTKGALPTAADIEAAAAADMEAMGNGLEGNATELLGSLISKAGASTAQKLAAAKRSAAQRQRGDGGGGALPPEAAARATQRDQAIKAARGVMMEPVQERLKAEAGGEMETAMSRVMEGQTLPPMLQAPSFPTDANGDEGAVMNAAEGFGGGVPGLGEAPAAEDVLADFKAPPGIQEMEGAGLKVDEMVEVAQQSAEMVQDMLAKLLEICGVELF